jgi:GT2 family glycosyltransferase
MGQLKVVILSRDDNNLEACIRAVIWHEPGLEILVVDDGLSRLHPAVIVRGQKPFIFARNANIGIRAAGDHDVILLNDDALLETPGGFTALQRRAEETPHLGIVAAATNVARLALPYSVAFVCVLLPRRVIDRVGLFDERFDCYGGEDDDYCYRVRGAGLTLEVSPLCRVDHSSLRSTFRPAGGGRSIEDAHRIFREKHGFEMASR